MRDFDIERRATPDEERQFRFHGQVFTRRDGVRPETLALIEDSIFANTSADVVKMLDQSIREFIEEADLPKWDAIRDPAHTPAVRLIAMRQLAEWLVEADTALPTESPSGAGAGAGDTAPSSTASSPSPEATSD